MKRVIELNKGWKLTWCSFKEEKNELLIGSTENWINAKVPGDVHLDLIEAGEGPDPYFGLNADLWRWVEEKDWWYRLDFRMPKILSGERAFLVFEGIDTFATVFLNGQKIAENSNMFTPIEVDITKIASQEENRLAVRIASPLFSVNVKADERVGSDWNIPRLFARKAQFNYGWDIAPRLISIGIWRPVKIEIYEKGRIKDVWIRIIDYDRKSAKMRAELEIELFEKLQCKGTCKIEIYEEGEKIFEKEVEIDPSELKQKVQLNFELSNPRLWYPNGVGEPFLYSYRATLVCDGKRVDEWKGNFGIRRVELIQEPQEDGGTSFYFKINGRKIFVKGFNWTPADALPARISKERYEELLKLVKEAGANMLRVWGGGIYEPEIFYDLCDKFGIMVWQDFMFACGHYPEHEDFLKEVKKEAEVVVRRLRRHACIAIWSGGNENDMFRFWREGKKYVEHKIRWILKDVCEELDPQTPFIPDSPFSPSGDNPNDTNEGDSHRWAHGKSYEDDFYLKDKSRFVSEIGHISVPSKEVLLKFIPEDKLWPPFNEYWYYHSSDTLRVGWKYRIESLFQSIRNNKLPEPKSLEEFIEVTQELQAKAYVRWVEHYASVKECGGILLWNVCDCWPQISDSVIAYPLAPKKAYYAVKEIFSKIREE